METHKAASLCTAIIILDIKSCITCGKSNLYWITDNGQNIMTIIVIEIMGFFWTKLLVDSGIISFLVKWFQSQIFFPTQNSEIFKKYLWRSVRQTFSVWFDFEQRVVLFLKSWCDFFSICIWNNLCLDWKSHLWFLR